MKEKELRYEIAKTAKERGWMYFYVENARYIKGKGFPDMVLVRDRRLIFAELKTKQGQLSAEQKDWAEALWQLREHYESPEYYLWRPADLENIKGLLQ